MCIFTQTLDFIGSGGGVRNFCGNIEFGGPGIPRLAPGAEIVVMASDLAPAKRRSARLAARACVENEAAQRIIPLIDPLLLSEVRR